MASPGEIRVAQYRSSLDAAKKPAKAPAPPGSDLGFVRHLTNASAASNPHTDPVPASAYKGLTPGPEVSHEYEPNFTQAIDGSNPLLRNLSPFRIQVEPPLIYADHPSFLERGGDKTRLVKAYGQAMKGLNPFASSSTTEGSYNPTAQGGASVEEDVTPGGGPKTNTTGSGDKVDSSGSPPVALGKPAIADLYVAVDIALQLDNLLNTPPLVLLINPTTLALAITKIQQFQDRTRYGYIFHAWGEEQPTLNITAKCGAFFSARRGVQFASKRDSASWQNLATALSFYRNNGYIYDTLGRSNAHHMVGALSIHWDQWIYHGHMQSFGFAYNEENALGGIEFQMEFVVSMMIDTAQPTFAVKPMKPPMPDANDPRYTGPGSKAFNRPGEFSVGLDEDGTPRLTTQSRVVSPAEAAQVLIPGGSGTAQFAGYTPPSATEFGTQGGVATQPVIRDQFEVNGFGQGPGERQTRLAQGGSVEPFRVGGGSG